MHSPEDDRQQEDINSSFEKEKEFQRMDRLELTARIARLEALVETALSTVKEQGSSIKSLASDIQRLSDNVSNHVITTTKTNWGTLASWSAVVLTVVTLGGVGFIRDIGRLEDSYRTVLWEEVIPYLREGHVPVLANKIEELSRRLDVTDKEIQKVIEETDKKIRDVANWNREQLTLIEKLYDRKTP